MRATLALLALALLAGGCSIADRRAGTRNRWQERKSEFRPGQTSETDVLDSLGPPSRVVQVGRRTVFYYLLEEAHTWQLTLILYSQSDTKVRYDRAIFFFDEQGVLEQWSVSERALRYEADE